MDEVPSRDEQMLAVALAEDLGEAGDITTAYVLGGRGPRTRARILAKASGRISGTALAARVFTLVDASVSVDCRRSDGDAVQPGDEVLAVEGPAASLLEAERTALNVLAHLSGVATLTARFVAAVAGTRARIVDTRKTTPGWRRAEKAAVVHGGGLNHRIGLFDEVLIKENHLALRGWRAAQRRGAAGHAVPSGGAEGIAETVAHVRAEGGAVRITVEAETVEQAWAAADGGADAVLLDNFGVEGLAAAVARLAAHPRRGHFALEASGGVTLGNVAAIAATGVDRISVGALTHSAPVLDLSMLLESAFKAART